MTTAIHNRDNKRTTEITRRSQREITDKICPAITTVEERRFSPAF
jgi:hypothetical protein